MNSRQTFIFERKSSQLFCICMKPDFLSLLRKQYSSVGKTVSKYYYMFRCISFSYIPKWSTLLCIISLYISYFRHICMRVFPNMVAEWLAEYQFTTLFCGRWTMHFWVLVCYTCTNIPFLYSAYFSVLTSFATKNKYHCIC